MKNLGQLNNASKYDKWLACVEDYLEGDETAPEDIVWYSLDLDTMQAKPIPVK